MCTYIIFKPLQTGPQAHNPTIKTIIIMMMIVIIIIAIILIIIVTLDIGK
jgi:amino acid transporter